MTGAIMGRRILPMALCGVMLGAMGSAPAPATLPLACDVLRALPSDSLAVPGLDYQTTQDRKGTDIVMSMCTAARADGGPVVTLLLRQDISDSTPLPAQAQRDAMVAGLAETFGHDPDVSFPEIGETALWVADIGQLTVWYKGGRVMLIVTAGGGDAPLDQAQQIAQDIVSQFP